MYFFIYVKVDYTFPIYTPNMYLNSLNHVSLQAATRSPLCSAMRRQLCSVWDAQLCCANQKEGKPDWRKVKYESDIIAIYIVKLISNLYIQVLSADVSYAHFIYRLLFQEKTALKGICYLIMSVIMPFSW